eukprot:TRINITY_DN7957_c0_g2_i1.p1 TRINITY_DN7957_c0_g2~~TRINITY_DN7957_c0_g2_i1.p1  ORF type:complete len:268 (+),score=33.56 TRINITY_DN7957_c0_g2_i1:53-805(+)
MTEVPLRVGDSMNLSRWPAEQLRHQSASHDSWFPGRDSVFVDMTPESSPRGNFETERENPIADHLRYHYHDLVFGWERPEWESPEHSPRGVPSENSNDLPEQRQAQAAQALQHHVPNDAVPRDVIAGFTTLVVRNIPFQYTQNKLLEEFEPDGSFDLCFLRHSIQDRQRVCYALMNFRWHGQFLRNHGYTDRLDVAVAAKQGVVENLRQIAWTRSLLVRFGMVPALFDGLGNRLDSMQMLQGYGLLPDGR